MNLVLRVLARDLTCAQAAACLGVSRKTMQGYVSRYREDQLAGLVPRSRRPHTSPAQLPQWVEDEVMRVRKEHPGWGARKIRWTLRSEPERLGGFVLPAASTVHQVLVRHGEAPGLARDRGADADPSHRFQARAPNVLWQVDAWEFVLDDSSVCWVLDYLDDHSRFWLSSRAWPAVTTEAAWEQLVDTVAGYGMPARLLSDNDLRFTGRATNSSVVFERQASAAGITLIHGRRRHPQTQGKAERSHRTAQLWLADQPPPGSPDELQQLLDGHRDEYNHQRPHDALDGATPASRYRRGQPVQLPLAELQPADTYPADAARRRVKRNGWFGYNRDEFNLGTKFAGVEIGLIHRGARLHVYYGAAEIATYALGYQPPDGSSSPPTAPRRDSVQVQRPQRSEDERP